jgi:putative membrane protein
MYRLPLQVATLGVAILISSAHTSAQTQSQTQTQRDRDTRSGTYQSGTSQANPTTFKDKLIEMNYAEIHLGHLAMMNSQNSRVRDLADMIVRDHTQALSRLQGTQTSSAAGQTDNTQSDTDQAQVAGREKPNMSDTVDRSKLTREHQQTADRLSKLSGAQFDREFINTMITEHRNAIRMLEQETRTSGDRDRETASIAQEMLPKLRMHLTEAEQIQKELQSGTR